MYNSVNTVTLDTIIMLTTIITCVTATVPPAVVIATIFVIGATIIATVITVTSTVAGTISVIVILSIAAITV